jgi:hypothetical protein
MNAEDNARLVEQLAAGAVDETDLRILRHMAELYERADPVPTGLVERIQFGITLDALHAEIAQLQRSAELTGVRSSGAPDTQSITFTSTSLTTMVTITVLSADYVRVDGWLAPVGEVSVELRTRDRTFSVTSDPDGRFVFESVPRGLAQFAMHRGAGEDGPGVVTPTIEI